MKKQHKQYSRPMKRHDLVRMEDEEKIVNEFGLKNKRELWKANTRVEKLRNQAKALLIASQEEQKAFLEKLHNLGLIANDAKIDDVLSLTTIDLLKRRLQTILVKKGFATKSKQARQMITHKHVLVEGHIVNVPSFTVGKNAENDIKLKLKIKKEKPKLEEVSIEKQEEAPQAEQ